MNRWILAKELNFRYTRLTGRLRTGFKYQPIILVQTKSMLPSSLVQHIILSIYMQRVVNTIKSN